MKIGFDVSPLFSGHKGRGIGFYTKNLLEQLKKEKDLDVYEFTNINDLKNIDVVHYPYFDLFNRSLPLKNKYPTVVTVHDVIPLKYPENFPLGIKAKINLFYQKNALKNVSAIITDSNASKRDINKYLKISEFKTNVVYLGVSDKFKPIKNLDQLEKTKIKYSLPDKFALFVGNVNWNKNILNMTQACLDANIDLVIVGKSFINKENLNHPELRSYKLFLEKYSNNPRIHILGYIEDEDLISIYNLAAVTLLISFDEGFGLPILESQSCGTPIIASNNSAMSEIVGKESLLVDPQNVASIVKAINKIINNKEVRSRLIKQGLENIKNFTWNETLKETVKVYKSVVSSNYS